MATLDPRFERNLKYLSIAVLAGIFGYLLVYLWHHESADRGKHLGDFITFYQAGQCVRQGRDIYTAGGSPEQLYVYPPMIAVLSTPFTYLRPIAAAHAALLLNMAVLLASIFIGAEAMRRRLAPGMPPQRTWAVAALVALLAEDLLRQELTMLETDALMLLVFTLGLWWLDRRPMLAGAALAFGFNIKYLPVIAIPWLLLRRRWNATAAALWGAVLFALAPALALGWREDLRCLRVSFGGLLKWVGVKPQGPGTIWIHGMADWLSVSITSALARALEPRGWSDAKVLAAATGVALATLILVMQLYARRRLPLWRWPAAPRQLQPPYFPLVALEWAGLVTAALVFSPDTNTRHLVIAVLVYAAGATLLLADGARWELIVALLAICIGFMMPFRRLHHGWIEYGVPGISLLAGYLLILRRGVQRVPGEGDLAGATPRR